LQRLSGWRFLLGDERCVPETHADSNYGMVMRTLFAKGVPEGCAVIPMDAVGTDLDAAADQYAAQVPEVIDLLLLSIGEDGHIASLFPGSPTLHESNRLVVPTIEPRSGQRRITMTPPAIRRATRTFVFACGAAKERALAIARQSPMDHEAIPARLVLDATWLTGNAATIARTVSDELKRHG
jgi:6-phosphogluconolactonase